MSPYVDDDRRQIEVSVDASLNDSGVAAVVYSGDVLHGTNSVNLSEGPVPTMGLDRGWRDDLIEGVVDDFEEAWDRLAEA